MAKVYITKHALSTGIEKLIPNYINMLLMADIG